MQAMEKVMREAARHLGPGTIVTDAGSVKIPVVEMARRLLPFPSRFVGGHPMAGSEKSGCAAASPSLFQGRVCVLTPVPGTDPRSVAAVARLWGKAGASVVKMSPRRHDEAVARVSHLPHAVAAALVLSAGRDRSALRLASGGFMDGTRVSLGDPLLWEGIFRSNRGELLSSLKVFGREISLLRRAIASRRGSGLRVMLAKAREVRSGLRRGRE
jgi:prephenate dehydrogenase